MGFLPGAEHRRRVVDSRPDFYQRMVGSGFSIIAGGTGAVGVGLPIHLRVASPAIVVSEAGTDRVGSGDGAVCGGVHHIGQPRVHIFSVLDGRPVRSATFACGFGVNDRMTC